MLRGVLIVRCNEATIGFSLVEHLMRETTLDEICEQIGYSGTRVVAAWYSGRSLYVPSTADAEHPLATLVGLRPLRRLVARYGGWAINVPSAAADAALQRDRRIAEMLGQGMDVGTVATLVDLSARRVDQIRDELQLRGWISFAAGRQPRRGRLRAGVAAPVPEILGTGEAAGSPPGGLGAGKLGTGGVSG